MKSSYLLINFFTLLIPFLWSFESKIQYARKWKFLFPAILFPALVFLVWDYFKTLYGVWGFNPDYTTGYQIGGLPIEEILFFITVPYSCVFIYEVVHYYFHREFQVPVLKTIFTLTGIVFFVSSFFFWGRAYTWSVLFLSGPVLPLLAYTLAPRPLFLFSLSTIICLFPMFVVNGLLTALPVVIYNGAHHLGFRIGTIPVEDFLYFLLLYSMNIGVYEWFKSRAGRIQSSVR